MSIDEDRESGEPGGVGAADLMLDALLKRRCRALNVSCGFRPRNIEVGCEGVARALNDTHRHESMLCKNSVASFKKAR